MGHLVGCAVDRRTGGHRAGFGGARAVRGVSLSVRGDEKVGLVGENGTGKSNLVMIFLGSSS
jgi:ABC-type sugar transport system ATPase subunit